MGWVTGFIMVIMAIGNFWFHSHLSRTVHHQQTAEITQQAADFIRYMNAINDYLYQHPERRAAGGQLTSAQLGLPATKTSATSSVSSAFLSGQKKTRPYGCPPGTKW